MNDFPKMLGKENRENGKCKKKNIKLFPYLIVYENFKAKKKKELHFIFFPLLFHILYQYKI